jgi:hypothetical protein
MKYLGFVAIFVVTFLLAFGMLVLLMSAGQASGLDGYPGPYPGLHHPLVTNGWDGSPPTPTLPPPPMPTSTPSAPPTDTPCDRCWTCNDVECYQSCQESCGCYFDEGGSWCVPCTTCEGGVRCRD